MSEKKTATQRFNDDFIEEVIEAVKANDAPWQISWQSGGIVSPYNATSGHLYSGRNAVRLALKAQKNGYKDPRWATARQINKIGGRINKGEKGTGVLFFQEKIILSEDNEVEKKIPRAKHYHVFNIEQTDLPKLTHAEIRATEPDLPAFADLMAHHAPKIALGKPEYRSSNDTIYLPDKGSFADDAAYYSTALHEMTHWTGHETRLNRNINNRYGTPDYAREELVAELSSYMLSLEHGLPFTANQNEAYLKHWAVQTDQELGDALRQAFDEAVTAKNYLDAPLREKRREQQQSQEEHTRESQDPRQTSPQAQTQTHQPPQPDYAPAVKTAEEAPEKEPERPQAITEKATVAPAQGKTDFEAVFYRETNEKERVEAILAHKRTYLSVNWEERREAKTLGAKWDSHNKLWVAEHGFAKNPELRKFVRRAADCLGASSSGKTIDDLRIAAEAMGLDMSRFDDTPGKWHRVPLHGRSPRDKDGAYKIFDNADGTLGAVIKNLSSGETLNWSNRGAEHNQVPDNITKAEEMNRPTRIAAQEVVSAEIQAERAQEMLGAYKTLAKVNGNEPYITRKGMVNIHGLCRLEDGSIVVPMINGERYGELADSETYLGIVNLQVISPDGEKRFARQCQKLGAYFPVGRPTERAHPEYVIVAEGVASAEAAYQLFAHANRRVLAVAAFDTSNLIHVAETIRQVYPDAKKILAVDNDLATEQKIGKNPGIIAAGNVAAQYPEYQLVIPPSIDGRNTDWNDALLADRKKALMHFADQVAGRETHRSQISPVAEQPDQSESRDHQRGKTEAGQSLLPNITGLCPREVGKKCYEATGGDPRLLPQIKSELAKQGYQFDERRLSGVNPNPLTMRDAYCKAVSASRRQGVKETAMER